LNERSPVVPGIYPCSTLPPHVPPSERKVHEAIAPALPTGWSAWHSLKIRTKPGDFSEADFVIANPTRGILILECHSAHLLFIKVQEINLKFFNQQMDKFLPDAHDSVDQSGKRIRPPWQQSLVCRLEIGRLFVLHFPSTRTTAPIRGRWTYISMPSLLNASPAASA
jgi:hypothetical protein